MADLIDRIAGRLDDGSGATRPKIPIHSFIGGYRLYVAGLVTRAELAQDYDLQGDELTQAVALADAVDAESTALAKMRYVLTVEGVCFRIEDHEDDTLYHNPDGTIDKAKVAADLGI